MVLPSALFQGYNKIVTIIEQQWKLPWATKIIHHIFCARPSHSGLLGCGGDLYRF